MKRVKIRLLEEEYDNSDICLEGDQDQDVSNCPDEQANNKAE